MNTNRIILPLLIFVFMVAILLLAGEAFYSDQAKPVSPTVWQPIIPSTGTPVPQTARTQWWVEIKTPTPKPTMTMTVTPTVTETKAK